MSKLDFLSRFDTSISAPHQIHKMIEDGLNSNDWAVRGAAVRNLNATKEHLDKALSDRDYSVRSEAAQHPNLTKEHLDKALSDSDLYVRDAATRNPNYTKFYPTEHKV